MLCYKLFLQKGYNIHISSQLEEFISFLSSKLQTVATLCADTVNKQFEFIHRMLQTQSVVIRIQLNSMLEIKIKI